MAAVDHRRIHATYAPGIYETTRMITASVALLTFLATVVLGFALLSRVSPPWGFSVLLFAGFPLAITANALHDVVRSVGSIGRRRILLRRGWVEIGPTEVRHLRDARLHTELARLGWGSAFARITLTFSDGHRLPLLQGPIEEVDRIAAELQRFMGAEPAPTSSHRPRCLRPDGAS